ncbi:cysteine hydrolase [Candidatus Poribacteria bacterium]|nr:cysteine hydrolase [Candidatus Poribacteria bacterium]
MSKLIFWDVDTQYDFMMESGNLYVPDAESIIPNLEKLTQYARTHSIPILGSVDEHTEENAEIDDEPDFQDTFPPHCMKGTPGQKKINATKPRNPLWIESRKYDEAELARQIKEHDGEIIFTKQKFDVFSNPNVDAVLDILKPEHIVVYGVALDVCDAYAIEGFLKRGRYKISLVEDATKPINLKRAKELIEKWKSEGVQILTTEEVIGHEKKDRR